MPVHALDKCLHGLDTCDTVLMEGLASGDGRSHSLGFRLRYFSQGHADEFSVVPCHFTSYSTCDLRRALRRGLTARVEEIVFQSNRCRDAHRGHGHHTSSFKNRSPRHPDEQEETPAWFHCHTLLIEPPKQRPSSMFLYGPGYPDRCAVSASMVRC